MNRTIVAIAVALTVSPAIAHATGWHHLPPIVKPPIVIPPVVTPPVVVPPVVTPPVVTPPPTVTPPPATPAQQPVYSQGKASPWPGYIAFAGVAVYFTAAIYSHWVWCAQREEKWHKDNKVARCYNAERDGLPRP